MQSKDSLLVRHVMFCSGTSLILAKTIRDNRCSKPRWKTQYQSLNSGRVSRSTLPCPGEHHKKPLGLRRRCHSRSSRRPYGKCSRRSWLPGGVVPLGFADFNGRAFGMNIIACDGEEHKILHAMRAWEATFPDARCPPAMLVNWKS